jgi:hypothetical protein
MQTYIETPPESVLLFVEWTTLYGDHDNDNCPVLEVETFVEKLHETGCENIYVNDTHSIIYDCFEWDYHTLNRLKKEGFVSYG